MIQSLRAFRRARDGDAKGRGSGKRIRWPDAKVEVTGAECDLRKEQQRERREESREKREEGREKREERDKHDEDERVEGRNGAIPDRRDGTEKGRPLGGKREESREERREKRGERRGEREESRGPKRGRQRSPNEAAKVSKEVPRRLWAS